MPALVRVGEAVSFTLVVENDSDVAIDLILRGRSPTFDVSVWDSSGAIVWRRLENEVIPAIVHVRRLESGESFDLPGTWEQRVEAGTYTARGELLLEDSRLSSDDVQFEVEDGRYRILRTQG